MSQKYASPVYVLWAGRTVDVEKPGKGGFGERGAIRFCWWEKRYSCRLGWSFQQCTRSVTLLRDDLLPLKSYKGLLKMLSKSQT